MSQTQYKTLMSNLLNEKHALAKIRAELEGRKKKLCRCCKGFGHLARNCRKLNEEGKGATTPQNKFEILSSRVMQYGVEEKTIRSMRTAGVKCFKCGKEGHKCRKCPLWVKRKNGEKRPVHPVKGKVQEGERRLRRVEGSEAVRPTEGNVQQEK